MASAVKNDSLVTLSVRIADMSGKVLEETGPEGIQYLHGHGDIFPKLEKALEGRFPGEGFFIKLEPEEAFGEYDSDAIRMVPLRELGDDPDAIVPGLVFEKVPGAEDDGRRWYVTDVAEGYAVLEPNHPYAGWALQFEIKVLAVEDTDGVEALGNDDVVVPSFLSVLSSNGLTGDSEADAEEDAAEEAALDAAIEAHRLHH